VPTVWSRALWPAADAVAVPTASAGPSSVTVGRRLAVVGVTSTVIVWPASTVRVKSSVSPAKATVRTSDGS
jgi:hypothetical protein